VADSPLRVKVPLQFSHKELCSKYDFCKREANLIIAENSLFSNRLQVQTILITMGTAIRAVET
jgi:hypothetical protein